MTQSDDPLDRQVALRAELTQNGVNAAAQSRAVAAFDSLCGSVIDLVGAPIDGLRRRQRAKDRVREEVIVEEGRQALEDLRSRRAFARHLDELNRLQRNREAVAAAALEQLKLLPSSAHASGSEKDSDAALDEDWLHVFGKFAEASSAETFTALWGRILAGEVHTPGAFSRSTLRVVAELDQGVAAAFDDFAKYRLHSGLVPHVEGMNFGLLADAGLIQDVTGMGGNVQTAPDGQKYWREAELVLIFKNAGRIAPIIPGFRLTRAGREIASILPPIDPVPNMKELAKAVSPHVQQIELFEVVGEQMRLLEVLHPGP